LYKTLKNILNNDGLVGFTFVEEDSYEVNINVESLWNSAKKRAPINTIDRFIKEFCATMVHEHLHIVIGRSYGNEDKWDMGEELIVWTLLEEKMPKISRKYYEEEFYK